MSKHCTSLPDNLEIKCLTLISDKAFWPGQVPPKDIDQLVKWLVEDLIDYYDSYRRENKYEPFS